MAFEPLNVLNKIIIRTTTLELIFLVGVYVEPSIAIFPGTRV